MPIQIMSGKYNNSGIFCASSGSKRQREGWAAVPSQTLVPQKNWAINLEAVVALRFLRDETGTDRNPRDQPFARIWGGRF